MSCTDTYHTSSHVRTLTDMLCSYYAALPNFILTKVSTWTFKQLFGDCWVKQGECAHSTGLKLNLRYKDERSPFASHDLFFLFPWETPICFSICATRPLFILQSLFLSSYLQSSWRREPRISYVVIQIQTHTQTRTWVKLSFNFNLGFPNSSALKCFLIRFQRK